MSSIWEYWWLSLIKVSQIESNIIMKHYNIRQHKWSIFHCPNCTTKNTTCQTAVMQRPKWWPLNWNLYLSQWVLFTGVACCTQSIVFDTLQSVVNKRTARCQHAVNKTQCWWPYHLAYHCESCVNTKMKIQH